MSVSAGPIPLIPPYPPLPPRLAAIGAVPAGGPNFFGMSTHYHLHFAVFAYIRHMSSRVRNSRGRPINAP